jgi:hypothetical protein
MTIPSLAVPLIVHAPVRDRRRSQEIGPVPRELGARWATGEPLAIARQSNLPLWDGTRPDYDLAVGALLAAR